MSIERAIHERWATDAGLTARVPAARVLTGTALSAPATPYVVIRRTKTATTLRTSSGTTVDDATIEMNIWSENLETAKNIALEIDRRFDRTEFTAGDERILHMRRTDQMEQREAGDVWHATLTYLVMHQPTTTGVT